MKKETVKRLWNLYSKAAVIYASATILGDTLMTLGYTPDASEVLVNGRTIENKHPMFAAFLKLPLGYLWPVEAVNMLHYNRTGKNLWGDSIRRKVKEEQ